MAATVLVAAALAACTSPVKLGENRSPAWGEAATARPVVDLEFTMADDLASASGHERVVFTPDLQVCELVFRDWPNKPATAERGNSLEVVSAKVNGAAVEPVVQAAGAPPSAPGTLVELPLPACSPAGTPVTAELDFRLTLGPRTDERVGVARDGTLAWFGTAYPLLAWENGRGWARDEAVRVTGETATSEVFDLASLRVTAPSRYAVLGTGELVGSDRGFGSRTTHEFRAPAVRDVTVTVGELSLVERRVGDTVIHVGGPAAALDRPLDQWADAVADSVKRVSDYLGPVPYHHLWVSVIPDQTEGIEFPGAIQLGNLDLDRDRWLITHEVAHQWFYGLVGNNQALHPWMDESFASFVQQVVDDPRMDPEPTNASSRRASSQVGGAMADWDGSRRGSDRYVSAVYGAGADMLINARRDAGPQAFDQAMRAYLHDNANRIATPADVEHAFAHLPKAIERMKAAGAL